jgi:ribosomal protein L31
MNCTCGKEMKFHSADSEEPLEIDVDEIEGSFYYCACGKIKTAACGHDKFQKNPDRFLGQGAHSWGTILTQE